MYNFVRTRVVNLINEFLNLIKDIPLNSFYSHLKTQWKIGQKLQLSYKILPSKLARDRKSSVDSMTDMPYLTT